MVGSKTFSYDFHLLPGQAVVTDVHMHEALIVFKAFCPALSEGCHHLAPYCLVIADDASVQSVEGNVKNL